MGIISMKKFEDFDLKRLLIESVVGLAISLAIGVILFWLTLGTVTFYDAGVYSAGYTEFSFIIGVLIAATLFGSMERDILSAGILGLIIGLLTTLLEGFVLSLFWSPMTVQLVMGWWGNHAVILIFVGVMASIGFNLFFSRNNSIPQRI